LEVAGTGEEILEPPSPPFLFFPKSFMVIAGFSRQIGQIREIISVLYRVCD